MRNCKINNKIKMNTPQRKEDDINQEFDLNFIDNLNKSSHKPNKSNKFNPKQLDKQQTHALLNRSKIFILVISFNNSIEESYNGRNSIYTEYNDFIIQNYYEKIQEKIKFINNENKDSFKFCSLEIPKEINSSDKSNIILKTNFIKNLLELFEETNYEGPDYIIALNNKVGRDRNTDCNEEIDFIRSIFRYNKEKISNSISFLFELISRYSNGSSKRNIKESGLENIRTVFFDIMALKEINAIKSNNIIKEVEDNNKDTSNKNSEANINTEIEHDNYYESVLKRGYFSFGIKALDDELIEEKESSNNVLLKKLFRITNIFREEKNKFSFNISSQSLKEIKAFNYEKLDSKSLIKEFFTILGDNKDFIKALNHKFNFVDDIEAYTKTKIKKQKKMRLMFYIFFFFIMILVISRFMFKAFKWKKPKISKSKKSKRK